MVGDTIKEFKDLHVSTETSMFLKNCHQNLDLLIRERGNALKVPPFLKFRCIIRLNFELSIQL